MKEFRKNQFRYGWTRTLHCIGKIRAAEEDCTQQEIVSALLMGYLDSYLKTIWMLVWMGIRNLKNQTTD